MARLLQIVVLVLSLAMLAGSSDAFAGPKRGGGKKGSSRSAGSSSGASAKEKAAAREKAADPLGEIGSGGVRGAPAAAGGTGAAPQRGPTRIDFDDRLIQGQTNRSGAVYLYDRKELQTKSMVKKRETFRQEILSTVYDTQ